MEDCIFCAIAQGSMEADIVHSDEMAVAFRDINPQAPVHVLVIPRKHVYSVLELAEQDEPLLCHLFKVIRKVVDSEGIASGVRILTNVGKEADQIIPHLHFHLMGGRKMLWPPG